MYAEEHLHESIATVVMYVDMTKKRILPVENVAKRLSVKMHKYDMKGIVKENNNNNNNNNNNHLQVTGVSLESRCQLQPKPTLRLQRPRLRLQMQRLHGNSPLTKMMVWITRNCWQDPLLPWKGPSQNFDKNNMH